MKRKTMSFAWCVFGIYAAVMLWLLFGQRWSQRMSEAYLQQLSKNLNLVPLRTIRQYIRMLRFDHPKLVHHAIVNLVGNVVMFIPLGFFLPLLFDAMKCYRKHLCCTLLILTLIELIQLLTLLGSCDVDDLLLNIPGTAIGYGIYRLLFEKNGNKG